MTRSCSFELTVDSPGDECLLEEIENHEHTLALFFCYYNFCRIHQSLCFTPAMAARLQEYQAVFGN